jgi:hypothetical protein
MTVTPRAAAQRATLVADARDVGLLLLAGAAAGGLAGAVVGGLGGRLVMLVLRLTSDPIVLGVTSDDGFEIGRFTLAGTLGLVGAMAAIGAANGALYAVLRGSIPRRFRALLWTSFAAAFGGSQFVHADGVDFTLLEPRWFAVVSFVALPGLAALVVVVLVERWRHTPARQPRPLALAPAAAVGTVGLVPAAALGVVTLLVRRLRLTRLLARIGRIVVPGVLLVGTVIGAWYTVVEASRILD